MLRLLTLFSLCIFATPSANFLRGSKGKCGSSTSISVKDIPCSGSVAVTEENLWENFELADNSVQSYESDFWKPSGNAYITNIGIPIHLRSGEIFISADMKCADTRSFEQLNIYSTNNKFMAASGSEDAYYTNVWLTFNYPVLISKYMQCHVTTQIMAIREVNIRFMLNEESYQFGLVNVPGLPV